MRWMLALIISTVPALAQFDVGNPFYVASFLKPAAAGGGGGSPSAFSDDFDRANGDSLGANWTEAAGDADIVSNEYRISTGGFGVVTSVYTGEACTTANQYVMITIDDTFLQYPWVVLRYTDSSSPYYAVQFDGNNGTAEWYKFDDASDTSGDSIGTVDTGADLTGVAMALTITGTGASTVVRIWRTPGGLPSAADNWNGDTSPDGSLTDDPGANAVDTGIYVGIGGQVSAADTLTLNNFFGGDIP